MEVKQHMNLALLLIVMIQDKTIKTISFKHKIQIKINKKLMQESFN